MEANDMMDDRIVLSLLVDNTAAVDIILRA